MSECAETRASAVVLPFVMRQPHPLSFNVSERIQALRWADAARANGVRELRIHEPEVGEEPSLGGFLLIYEDDDIWASWGVAVRPGSFEVWRPSTGTTIGWFPTLREALLAVKQVV
jgi:hypothetical protein